MHEASASFTMPCEIENDHISVMAKSGSVSNAVLYFIRTCLEVGFKEEASIDDLLSYITDELYNWYSGSWVV